MKGFYRIFKQTEWAAILVLTIQISLGTGALYAQAFTEISAGLTGVDRCALEWGDYDNDGDLDILLSGASGTNVSRVYRNDAGVFTNISASLDSCYYSAASWGDYDNDGDLDILLTGFNGTARISKVYRNDSGNFTDISAGLVGVYESAVAWGDYDNDGDLDILLAGSDGGTYYSLVYRNDDGAFTDVAAGLPGVVFPALAWGDYDNDGDLDILLTGQDLSATRISKIYQNNNGVFSDIAAGLPGVWYGSVAWGDFDQDGDLDFILTGGDQGDNRITKMYRNDGGIFTEISTSLPGIAESSVAWGDYDNDGDLDILMTGSDGAALSRIYRNDSGIFTDISAGLAGCKESSAAWGDYDNDGDLDIVYAGDISSGNYITKLYRNNIGNANTLPSAPTGLTSAPTANSVTLSWNKSTDSQTSLNGLTYNLRIGTSPGGSEIVSPMANTSNGYRKIARIGNTEHDTSWVIKDLPIGTYYWSVQAVDNAFAGSSFAAEDSFTVSLFTEVSAGLLGVYLSHVSWGDYDNDDDLDLILTGDDGANRYTRLYKNEAGSFTNQSAGLGQVFRDGTSSWGDYDNDGDLDLLFTGGFNAKIYQNTNGSFTDIGANIYAGDAQHGASDWGDYDNDGNLDIIFAGSQGTKLYRNNGGTFDTVHSGIIGVFEGDVTWGDFDNDGDLDLAICGTPDFSSKITRIYRNDAGTFVDINAGLPGVYNGGVTWGDYDNDGDLDLVIAGYGDAGSQVRLFKNSSGSFSEVSAGFSPISDGSGSWGDYDNDGDLDLLVTGSQNCYLYRNDGSDTFVAVSHTMSGVNFGYAAWGDFDNDGDLDIALTGNTGSGYVTKLYRNNSGTANNVPVWPSNLSQNIAGTTATLSWQKSTDTETTRNGLTFNLRVGSSPGGYEIVSPMTNISNGFRRVAELGNTNHDSSWTLKNLPDGTYYWAVQAIDNAFAGSLFSAEQSFSILDYRRRDSLALVDLYDSTGGSGWTNSTNWKSANPIDTWYGVNVSGGRVNSLDLTGNNLVGNLPAAIGNLSELQYLKLGSNSLSGFIPSEIGDLTNLQELYIHGNQFTGQIPPSIGNLSNLRVLFLQLNYLTGAIPPEIGNLSQVQLITVSGNNLSGSIPAELGSLPNLTALYLNGNQFSGSIPPSLGNLSGLQYLTLSNNQLSGSIPTELGALSQLKWLWLASNQLSGTIPVQIANLASVTQLYLDHNGLSGNVPDLTGLTSLQELRLNSNMLTGLVDLNSLATLTDLSVENNKLTFEDIEPNIGAPSSTFTYSPQDSVGIYKDTAVVISTSTSFDVFVGGANNQYQWYKNGNIIDGATSATYTIPSASPIDAGTYHCQITNTIATALTLYSRTFKLRVALSSDLVAYYPFNANTADESGYGNNGTNNGATQTTDRFGNANSAYYFNGSSLIDCGDPMDNSLDLTGDFTISSWIHLTDFSSQTCNSILSKDEGQGTNNKWIFGYSTNSSEQSALFHAINVNGSNSSTSFSNQLFLGLSQWYHVTLTNQSNMLTFYLNGIASGSTPFGFSVPDANTSLRIGMAENGFFFNGKLDDISIYNRTLAVNEIDSLYHVGGWGVPPSATTNVSAVSGNQQIMLHWNASAASDFMRYRIYYGTSPNPTTQMDSTNSDVGKTDTVRTFTGFTNGTTYYFRVTALDSAGNASEYSNEVSAKPYDLVAYYLLDGNASDVSGNGINGTINEAVPTTDRFGNANSALYFDGINDYVQAPADLLPTASRTISAWFYANTLDKPVIWAYGGDGGATSLLFSLNLSNANNMVAESHFATYQLSYAYTTPPVQKWFHVVLTIDPAGSKMYLNGNIVASNGSYNDFTYVNGRSLFLGTCIDGDGTLPYSDPAVGYFNGILDDILFYNRALSEYEIDSLYHFGGWDPPPPTITSFAPTSGPIGTSVTITGTNFNSTASNNIVYFGAVKAEVTNATSTSLSVTAPVGATYAPITVTDTTTGLTAYSNAPFVVTFSSSQVIDATSFANKVDFASGSYPYFIAIGDIDGDGKPELANTNWGSSTVSVYRNTSASGSISASSFDPKVDFTTGVLGVTPVGITIGDLDGDGKLDLAVTNFSYQTVSIFRNTSISGSISTSSFNPKVDFAAGGNSYCIAIGDLDGDGKPDLVEANTSNSTVSVFRNTSVSGSISASSFAPKVDFTAGLNLDGVAIGDIDGDGKPDLVVVDFDNTVSVFRNTSSQGFLTESSFDPKVDFTRGSGHGQVAIVDIDGDDKPDLAVTNRSSNTVSVLRNTSIPGSITASSFADKVDLTVGSEPRGISIGDIDGDGKPDIAFANYYDNTVSVLRNTSISGSIEVGSFAAKVDFLTGTGPGPFGVAIGDLDGDGKPDLAVANYEGNIISVLRNTIPSGRDLDSLALVALYDSTGGPSWTNSTNWKSANPIDTWYGVTVSGGRVVKINLQENNLTGSLPASVENMTGLRELYLDINHLTTFPVFYEYASQLQILSMTSNSISATIPSEIGNLTNLESLSLENNLLSGSIPSEIGNLVKLRHLSMQNNQLSGSIPISIGFLTELLELRLSYNQLTGTIPMTMSNLTQLQVLHLRYNQLSGQIPSFLGNFVQLSHLYLTSNQFSGTIPDEIGNMSALQELHIDNNLITGQIPATLGNLSQLQVLEMGHNQLSGSIPEDIGDLTQLKWIVLDHNQLSGSVPSSIGNLSNLLWLKLNDNQLTGLPDLALLDSLQNVYIENNKFTFEDIVPNIGAPSQTFTYSPQDSVGAYSDTTVETGAYFSCPLFVGGTNNFYMWYKNGSTIPNMSPVLVIPSVTLQDSGIYHCQITNTVATALTLYSRTYRLHVTPTARDLDSLALVALFDSAGGEGWTNNGNWITSNPIDTWYGVTGSGGRVTSIDLSNNNLTGFITTAIGNLDLLTCLYLHGNQLSGIVPTRIWEMNNLTTLYLGDNNFSPWSIPASISNMTSLVELFLRGGSLVGTIPSQIGNLTNLVYLNLDSNQLTGSIPAEIGNLINLHGLNLSRNQLSGNIPEQIGNLTNLQFLQLGSNQFTGTIPTQIGNLTALIVLSLCDNMFSGDVPDLSNLSSLQTIYLYANRLTGLPNLSSLVNLNRLNLEENKLTFEDIEPQFAKSYSVFTYSPQDSVGEYKDTTLIESASLTLSVAVGGTQNQYQWFKNGAEISGSTSSQYIVNPVSAGVYHCIVTNTLATALTLYSRTVRVTVLLKPDAYTTSAGNFTSSSATLGGLVNAKGISTSVQFQYGLTVGLGQTVTAVGSPISQSGQVPVTGSVTLLTAGTTYYYRVTATNAAGSSFGTTAQFTTLDVAPQIQTGTVTVNPQVPSENQKITVSCGATGTNLSAKLFYGKASQITPDSVTMDWIGGTYSDSIPAQSVTFEGVWYRIRVSNSAGVSYYPSATAKQSITVNISSTGPVTTISTYPDGINQSQWFTVALSMSGSLNLSDGNVFGPQEKQSNEPTNWRALKYDASTGFTDVTVLNGNEAYLLFQRKGDGQDIFSKINSPQSNSATLFNSINLKPGWNLVPWPYTFTADMGFHDTDHDTISRNFYQMKGDLGWTPDVRMKPYSGFLIYNKRTYDVPIGSVIYWTRVTSKPLASDDEWNIQFEASAGKLHDSYNQLGVGEITLSEPEPLNVPPCLSLAFVSDEGKELSSDYTEEFSDGRIWNMTFDNQSGQSKAQLVWTMDRVPQELQAVLVDVSNNKFVDIRQVTRYEFISRKDHHFRVIVGKPEFVAREADRMRQELPRTFDLAQNYPNPFNPTTTIKFDVAHASQVRIKVYNILGQEVAVLVNRYYETGRYAAEWNGKDQLGGRAASGVYIYRLEAGKVSKTKKMLLIK